ncbi:hypothetical protein ACF1AJ_20560 [Leifsonia sp. NPDC014704]|uniref:hypothetical protein n=1 Tax=Leifsonia sp. NPDC014704 TaxID=3364123 RepID=UPI0036F494D5
MGNNPNSRRARLIRRAPRARTISRARMLSARQRKAAAAFRAAGHPLLPWQLDVLAPVFTSIPLGLAPRRPSQARLQRYYEGPRR